MFKSVVHNFLEVVTSGGGGRVVGLSSSSAGPLLARGCAASGGAGLSRDRLEGGGLAGDSGVRDRGGDNIRAGRGGREEWHRRAGGGGGGGRSRRGLRFDGRQDRDITYIVMIWFTWTERLCSRL